MLFVICYYQNKMNALKEYSSLQDNHESFYTILIHNKSQKDVVSYFEDLLEKSKKIHDPVKKYKINNQLFGFIQYVKNNYEEEEMMIHSIFLLHKKIVNHGLTVENIATAIKYNIPKIVIKNDNYLYIDYVIDLFENFTFIYGFRINKNELQVVECNKNKHCILETSKIVNEEKILEWMQKIKTEKQCKDMFIVCGQSPLLDKIIGMKQVIVEKKILNILEMYEIYERECNKLNHQLLEKRLVDMQNVNTNLDLYVFGKLKMEIKDAIEAYQIKELYITREKLEKLKTFIEDNSCFNFKIILIESLEQGDIACRFSKDYNGVMGIKYF